MLYDVVLYKSGRPMESFRLTLRGYKMAVKNQGPNENYYMSDGLLPYFGMFYS